MTCLRKLMFSLLVLATVVAVSEAFSCYKCVASKPVKGSGSKEGGSHENSMEGGGSHEDAMEGDGSETGESAEHEDDGHDVCKDPKAGNATVVECQTYCVTIKGRIGNVEGVMRDCHTYVPSNLQVDCESSDGKVLIEGDDTYDAKYTCCQTDKCNSADSLGPRLLIAIIATFMSLAIYNCV